jgi:hypothetical protein
MGRQANSRCSFEKPRPQITTMHFSTAWSKATIACVMRFGSEVRRAKNEEVLMGSRGQLIYPTGLRFANSFQGEIGAKEGEMLMGPPSNLTRNETLRFPSFATRRPKDFTFRKIEPKTVRRTILDKKIDEINKGIHRTNCCTYHEWRTRSGH